MQPEEHKYYENILWVDDFDKKVFDPGDDYDAPDTQDKPDYSSEIKRFFPPHLWERVHVETCADALPRVMEERAESGRSFDLVVLDINFSSASGRTSSRKEQEVFFKKLEDSGINTKTLKDPGSAENEKLGYYLMLYLMAGWRLRLDQIAFLTGNAPSENEKDSIFQTELGLIRPSYFFDKKDENSKKDFHRFLDKTFSHEELTDKAAIIYAKELFYYWVRVYHDRDRPSGRSLWKRAYNIQKSGGNNSAQSNKQSREAADTAIENYILVMKGVFEQNYYGDEKQQMNAVLRNACFLFEDKVKPDNIHLSEDVPKEETRLERACIILLKAVRNMYSHRVVKDGMLPEDFLLLFSLAMRALFEPKGIGKTKEVLPGEQWLVENLNRKAERSGEKDFPDKINHLLLCWYLEGQKKKERGYTFEDSLSLFFDRTDPYDISDVVKSFCIRAMQTRLYIKSDLNTGNSFISTLKSDDRLSSGLPYTNTPPSDSPPFDLKALAKAYINSRLQSEMKRDSKNGFYMNL